jgi:hypothetical protein
VIAQTLVSFGEQWAIQLLGQRAMHGLRLAIYDHVVSRRAAFFDRMPVGRLLTRMTNDIESVNEMFASGVITLATDAVRMLAIAIIMLSLDVELTLFTFATLPLLVVLVRYARSAMRRSFREIRVRLAAMNAFAQEHLSGIKVVQIFRREGAAAREYDVINAGHRDAYLVSIRADAAMYALVEAIGVLAVALVAWWAVHDRGAGVQAVATLGLVVAFLEYINKFFIPIATCRPSTPSCRARWRPPAHAAARPGPARRRRRRAPLPAAPRSLSSSSLRRRAVLARPSTCRGARPSPSSAPPLGQSTLIKLLTHIQADGGAGALGGVDIRAPPSSNRG